MHSCNYNFCLFGSDDQNLIAYLTFIGFYQNVCLEMTILSIKANQKICFLLHNLWCMIHHYLCSSMTSAKGGFFNYWFCADRGRGVVQRVPKYADVILEQPLITKTVFFTPWPWCPNMVNESVFVYTLSLAFDFFCLIRTAGLITCTHRTLWQKKHQSTINTTML